MSDNTHSEHDDERVEQLRVRYGVLADLTVLELHEKARQRGINNPSGKTLEELLQALSTGRKQEDTTSAIRPADYA